MAGIVLVVGQLLSTDSLYPQTGRTIPPDTTKTPVQKIQPEEEKTKLELPDVLIYGADRSVRQSGDKLENPYEDAKLIAPVINYQSLTQDLKLENQKRYFESQKEDISLKTMFQLDVGTFQQLNFEAGHWRQAENHNYSFHAKYDRSDGQYDNSQYYQGSIQAQFGMRMSPSFVLSSQGNFQLSDYGLYGAQLEDLQRKKSGGKVKMDAQWSLIEDRSTDLSAYFQQSNCKDDDGKHYGSKSEQRVFGLVSSYQAKYRSIPIFVRGLYEYQSLKNVIIDSANTQNFLQLKTWASIKFKKYFIIKPGIFFENLDVNDSLSKYQIWPDLEIIAMPIPRVGLLFKVSKEFSPLNYAGLFEKNPFFSHKSNFIPMRRELELRAAIEYNHSSRLSISTEIIRQIWKDYAYWFRESGIGLFQLASINQVTLTILNFQSRFKLSAKANFDAGIQIHFDEIKNDSFSKYGDNLPFLERFRIPFNFEYKINQSTQSRLSFVLIGPRYTDLNNSEKLSSFGLLSVHIEKQLIKNISAFIEGNNLLNQKYELWQKYPGMGFFIELGVKGNW